MKYTEMIKILRGIDVNQFDIIKIAVVSNVYFEPFLFPILKINFAKSNIDLDIVHISLEECFDKENASVIKNTDFVIIWLNIEALYPGTFESLFSGQQTADKMIEDISDLCNRICSYISTNSSAHILWFGFEDYFSHINKMKGNVYFCDGFIYKLNIAVYDLVHRNTSFIDIQRLIAGVGADNAYDNNGKYRWNAPYSQQLIQAAADEIYKEYLIYKGITKKCIVLDCDNVLWGGVLSEDRAENIVLGDVGMGRAYKDFQRFLLSLYFNGVILAVCSKNDLKDVKYIFRNHSDMILKEEHISCFQVNWENKADNIRNISEVLNIGLDSMVFIDDSKFEIELIKDALPEVVPILFEPSSIYNKISCFHLAENVDIKTVQARNNTYKLDVKRKELMISSSTYEGYLEALDMKVEIRRATNLECSRIAELSQRTNRCTNGNRYTVPEIQQLLKDENYMLYAVFVSDRFGELGLVGAIGVFQDAIDLFSLSCRALGRNVENTMLDFVLSNYACRSVHFQSTGKNDMLKKLFKAHSIESVGSGKDGSI